MLFDLLFTTFRLYGTGTVGIEFLKPYISLTVTLISKKYHDHRSESTQRVLYFRN